MNKSWDSDKGGRDQWIAWMTEVMVEVKRVLKPGAHGFVWALPRTSHWTATALEDAGFEVRDIVMHLFGQGFPKNLNVLKSAEKQGLTCSCDEETQYQMHEMPKANIQASMSAKEHEKSILQYRMQKQVLPEQGKQKQILREEKLMLEGREIHRTQEGLCNDKEAKTPQGKTKRVCSGTHSCNGKRNKEKDQNGGSDSPHRSQSPEQRTEEPNALQNPQRTLDKTPQSGLYCSKCKKIKREKLEGLGTGLKPACEHWVLIRKPLSEKTVAKNVLRWGCGAINIDGCRIEFSDNEPDSRIGNKDHQKGASKNPFDSGSSDYKNTTYKQGRFPANLTFDDYAANLLDQQSGVLTSGELNRENIKADNKIYGAAPNRTGKYKASKGFASRFFYVAKPSKAERNAGLEGMESRAMESDGCKRSNSETADKFGCTRKSVGQNSHPTVKSIKLMKYLITMITPPSGKLLDPFAGSGSTLRAAKELGFDSVGIEQDEEYVEIAKARIASV